MASTDLLPSWRPGHTKTAILEFLESVTSPGPAFVPLAERVAAFGNDGTLWCEKPACQQADLLQAAWKDMAQPRSSPTMSGAAPWKAVIEDDHVWLGSIPDHIPEPTVSAGQDGIATEALDNALWAFFNGDHHPLLGLPDTKIAYRPMCELVALLEIRQFQVYLRSPDHRDLIRVGLVDMHGQARSAEQPIDEAMRQPGHAWARRGHKPLLAGGNADSDIAMLKAAQFALMICPDDAGQPEFNQQDAAHALAQTDQRGWTIVSVRDDFKEVF
jgi:hypothetical protein